MKWSAELQARFDTLRLAEFAGTLSAAEADELAELTQTLQADDAVSLRPAMDRLRREQDELHEQLTSVQAENEELARLLSQQQQLVADARRWLSQFDQRHSAIRQAYSRLTGHELAAVLPR